jgi:hypothetical protein
MTGQGGKGIGTGMWLVCGHCNRIFRNVEKELERHAGHRPIRLACDEPWFHVLFRPVLLWEWLRLKMAR